MSHLIIVLEYKCKSGLLGRVPQAVQFVTSPYFLPPYYELRDLRNDLRIEVKVTEHGEREEVVKTWQEQEV